MFPETRLLGFFGLLAATALGLGACGGGGAGGTGQMKLAVADSAVTFNPVKTGIMVTANQTTTVDIP